MDTSGPARLGRTRNETTGLLIVWWLAALAGAVDACGFFLLKDLYVSFMSGNTTSMAAALARGDLSRVGLIAGLIVAFVAGSAFGTVVGFLSGPRRVPIVILAAWQVQAMAFAMGMLNATIHQAGAVEVTVTYVTGTLAKLGRGLGLLLCGQARDWTWLEQAVPWLGLVAGAALATLSLIHLGGATFRALPVIAVLIGIVSWFAVAPDPPPKPG